MLLWLCFSAISKYYSRKFDLKLTIDHTKLFPVCKVEILQVMVNKIEVLSSFRGDYIWLKVPKIDKRVPWFLADVHKYG